MLNVFSPICTLSGHTQMVTEVDWNVNDHNLLATAAIDRSVLGVEKVTFPVIVK